MIRGRLKRAQFTLNLLVFFMPLLAFSLSAYLRFATHLLPRYSTDADPSAYFGLLLLTTIFWAVACEHYEVASIEHHLASTGKVRPIVAACFVTYVAVLAITFFYRASGFSRLFIWSSALNVCILTYFVRKIFRWACLTAKANHHPISQVLIVGADAFALQVAQSLQSDPIAKSAIKGFVRLPDQTCAVRHSPVYELDSVSQLAIGNGIDDVIVALPPAQLGELPTLRRTLAPLCAPLRLVLDVGAPVDRHQRLFSIRDLLMLELQGTPAESVVYIFLKRAFDVVFSAAVLILAAPVFSLIAFGVWFSSPGPVFFVQERVGLNGQLFRMFKFRTMAITPKADSDMRWTVKNDPRCTAFGRLLRRTGLDELPQFLNVLKGDMSVVGPRPERPLLVQRFMQSVGNYNRRHFLKVGITGWAQVHGWRGDTSIEKRVEYDLYYVRHWTLALDLFIVMLTFIRGFTNKNAY